MGLGWKRRQPKEPLSEDGLGGSLGSEEVDGGTGIVILHMDVFLGSRETGVAHDTLDHTGGNIGLCQGGAGSVAAGIGV